MDIKVTLCGYLQSQRDTVLWKLEGASERDLRMPMTASGTNLLGLVKHLAGIEAEYFGECLGQPWPDPMPWWNETAEPNADMWATADESPEQIIELYRRVQAGADVAETARHAGHMDILRETADGQRGLLKAISNLPDVDEAWWRGYVTRLRNIAENSDSSHQ